MGAGEGVKNFEGFSLTLLRLTVGVVVGVCGVG